MNDALRYPPVRADHIGSLLRPPELRQAFRAFHAGKLNREGLVDAQNAAIRDAIKLRRDVGLPVVTDGEFRRGSYWSRFVEGIEGLSTDEARFKFHDAQGYQLAFTAPLVTGKVFRRAPLSLDDHASAVAKITLPAPSTMHFWRGKHYATGDASQIRRHSFGTWGQVYRAEIADLAAADCRYIQLDEVALAMLCAPALRARVVADGNDPAALTELYVEAIAGAIAAAPAGMAVGVHLCRGNFKGRYLSEGGDQEVAKALFACPGVTHFVLEFDTPCAGDFIPLRHVAPDKGVVLGLVSSKDPALEKGEDLLRRIGEAAQFIDRDRLALSPQCGFASTVAGNPLGESEQRAKLALCVETARAAWKN